MAKRKTPYGDTFEAKSPKLEFQTMDAIRADVLECFDYQYRGRDIEIATDTDEFTSVCPFSGLPDFGHLTITYVPDKLCVELRSLKYYFVSFRNVGIFYEHVCNKILDDLVALMNPKKLTVICDFTIRGGLSTTITAEYIKGRDGKKQKPKK
jgi:7-cyano-7-deazaguanine reductase